MNSSSTPAIPRRYPLLLGALTIAFALRVVGQIVAGTVDTGFLPPFEHWYSGVLPYSVLLPIQLVLLAVMVAIVLDFAKGKGLFCRLGSRTGRIMVGFSYLYAIGMIARYVVTMMLHPELRWFTGTIPIWFHLVLATFLYTFGRFQVRYSGRLSPNDNP